MGISEGQRKWLSRINRKALTLQVSQDIIDELSEGAQRSNRSLEEQAVAVLEGAVGRRQNLLASLEKARTAYDEHVRQTGEPRPTTEQLWEQMRRIREEVADELYPD